MAVLSARYWARQRWLVTNPTRRFIVYTMFMAGLVGYWFSSMGVSNDFPTSEVQYADMPALLHPYLFPWQAPYGIIWYAIQYFLVYTITPLVQLAMSLHSFPCTCYYIVNYVNGTRVPVQYESPVIWPMSLAWITGLAIFNVPFLWLLRKSSLLTAYFMTSLWLFATVPVDLSILWIIVLAYLPVKVKGIGVGWLFLPLALAAKFPVGAPGPVWTYALHSGSTLGHFFPYVLLGFWFVGLSIYWIDRGLHHGNLGWFHWLHPQAKVIAEYE